MPRTKYAIPLVLLTLLALFGFTQDGPLEPVKWTISSSQTDDEHAELKFHADVDEGWYVYSSISFGDMGPIPTTIELDSAGSAEAVGEIVEMGEKVLEGFDPLFDMNVKKFKGWADYIQKVKLNDPTKPITGRLDFMTCNDKECIFPDPLYFKVDPVSGSVMTDGIPFSADEEAVTGLPGSDEEILEPVTWELNTKELEDGTYEFNAVAHVQEGWYIYSQESFGDMGPIPTLIGFHDTLEHFMLEGEPLEDGPMMVEGLDPIFEMNVRKYKKEVTFSRVLKVSDTSKDITGAIDFMTCNDEACIFPDPLPFTINIDKGTSKLGLDLTGVVSTGGGDFRYVIPSVTIDEPVNDCGFEKEEESSIWWLFLIGFGGGFIALFTPCVFPMIPLTVSFFTKGSEDAAKGRMNAVLYGFFIFLIYFAVSVPFHLLKIRPEIFHEFATSIPLNLAFFAVFVFFAFSFFGYYEIQLPSSFTNKMDQKASKTGGVLGVFFMAVTLALVSFSCTGPILGTFLGSIFEKGPNALSIVMAGFGVALGLPFALFAMFPGWMNNLPKSGGWLNTVKVSLGFVELALAMKFVANADNVIQWGFMKREIFFAIWIVICLLWALYLFAVYYFPHDTKGATISIGRKSLGIAVMLFALYLVPGLTNTEYRNVRLISGFPPPLFYSIYPQESKCPLGLNCFKDYEDGMRYAAENNKPVLLDFTGWACVNCRRMEENVWPDERIFSRLNDDYVLISLYVDDRKPLPKDEQTIYTTKDGITKQISTYGQRYITLQQENFRNISQPWYVVVTPDGELLSPPVGYTPDEDEYADWLDCGLDAWDKSRSLGQR